MPTFTRTLVSGILALGLAACASSSNNPPAASAEPAPPPAADDKCNSAQAAQFVGQHFDDALLARVKAAVGHDTIRVIRPNQPVTMDFREERLNLDLDANDVVTRVHCV